MSCTFTVFSLIRNPDNYFIHKKKLLPYEFRKVTAFYHCSKKVQSQRFALQELLKQFLLMYHYCTSSFLFHKKVQSQRFALQELLKQFLLMYLYCTSSFLFHKKVQSQRFALQELLKQFLLMYLYCTSSFLFHKKIQPIFYYFSFSDTSASLVFPL